MHGRNVNTLAVWLLALVIAMGLGPSAIAFEGKYSPHYDVKQLAKRESFWLAQKRTLRTFKRLLEVFGRDRVDIGQLNVRNHADTKNPEATLPIFYCRILSRNAARERAAGKPGTAAKSEKVVLDVTGTHGVEGYVGMKLVRAELNTLVDAAEAAKARDGTTAGLAELPDDVGRLIFTAINPEGMHEYSRTSRWEDGNRNWWPQLVDALLKTPSSGTSRWEDSSRNWWPELVDPAPANPEYARLAHILNPEGPAKYRNWKHPAFLLPLLAAIGKEALRQRSLAGAFASLKAAVLRGQSKEKRKGVLWAGDPSNPDPRNIEIDRALRKQIAVMDVNEAFRATQDPREDRGAILVRDWHTGYGKWGHCSVVAPESENGIGQLMRHLGEGLDIGWAAEGRGFYEMRNSFISHMTQLFPEKLVLPWIFEFGTMKRPRLPQAIDRWLRRANLGPALDKLYENARDIESLQRVLQNHHGALHGFASAGHKSRIRGAFSNMFDRVLESWWQHAVDEVHRVQPGLLQRFYGLDLHAPNVPGVR